MAKHSPDAVSQAIQKLLEQRQEHLDKVARIDATIARVGAALDGVSSVKRGRPPKATAEDQPRKGRRRRRYKTTAEDSILAFVRQSRNPTTQQIKQHWNGENRGGTADNVLSRLVKDEKLNREPLKEGRGSRYTVA